MAGFGGFGPMGVLPAQETPELARTRLEGIASRSGVPVNVLMALAEAGVQDADTAAAAMAKEIALGRKVEDLIGPDVMNRAYDIADQIYPRPAAVPSAERPQDANALRDLPAAIGASVARAGGSAIRGVGEAVAGAADAVNQNIVNPILEGVTGRKNAMGMAPNPLDGAANAVGGDRGAAGFLDSFISEDVKRDQADLIDPKADLFSPSTWSLGPRPTVRGAVYSALDVFGSMAPVVVVGLLTKSPAAAAAAGGSMSAGDAAGQAEQAIDLMAQTKLPDGRSQLEAESSVYQRLMQDGASPEQALEITKRRAAQQSALLAAIPGALGGAATQRIIGGLEGAVSRLPWAGRVAATAGLSGIEEGAQEVAEGIAGRTGINSGAGMNRSVTEGTFNEAILGAMGGAPMGAIGGAFSRRDMPQEAPPPAPPAPPLLALPAPTSGGTIFGAGPVSEPGQRERTQGQGPTALGVQQPAQFRPNPPADGSGGAGGAPAGRVIPSPAPAGVAPMGPISRIAASAPDLTPVPAPVQRFPDQKPGKEVELLDPETGVLHPAVFLREEPDGAVVRIEGGEFKLSPEEFDAARVGAMQAVQGDAKKPATPKPQQPVAVEAPVAQPVQPVAPMPVVPADGLASKAASKVRPPAPPVKQMTPKDAADALAALEANVTKNGGGWNKRLLKKRAELQALAGIKPESEVSNGKVDREDGQLPDGGARRRGPVGADAGAVSPGGERNKEGVPQGGADTGSILAGGGEGGVDPAAQPEPSAPLTPDERPRPSPITTPPSQRVQPDMLGGSAVSEEQMATKERRRKEWGRFLGIAEHGKSSDDMELEGREVRIRPGKFIVMAKNDGQRSNDDRVIDTHGMSRDTIAAAARGALSELDRIAPLPMKEKAAAAPPPAPPAPVTKEPKAAENGEDRFAENRKAMGNFAKGMRVEFDAEGPFKKADGTTVDRETRRGSVASIDRKSGQGTVEVRVDGGVGGKGYDITIGAAQLRQAEGTSIDSDDRKNSWDIPANVPTAAEVKAAAAQADTKPTDAQKEAGNYQMGHIQWNGLDITIETAKGAMRRGKDRDGEEWSVKMPAHYGYIKGTRGADGDHLDIYMGPNPESTAVFIIDQVDADTGRFDEHKVMLGFVAREDAQAAYYEGFSDGRGEDRMGAITEQSVDQFKAFVQNNSWLLPISLHGQRGKNEPQSWDAGFADRFAKKPREVPSYFTQRKTSNGYQAYLRGWDAANKERMAPEIPGSTGTPGVLQVTKTRTGRTTTIDTRQSQPAPKPKAEWSQIGYSARSFPLYEDLNGVRSYVEGGIRITETVGIVPGGGITIDKSRRGRDFLTDEEFSAQREAKADQWKKPLGSAKPVSADPDFAEISLHLTGQIERAKAKKDAVGDATVRRLRMNLWKAEESLAKALAAANFEAFAPHEADFPIAATALRTAIGKRAGRVDLLKAAQDSGRLEIIHVTGKKEAAPEKPTYGASNTLVSADRAAELRARLKDKLKNQLNAGIDPEILAIGAELAVFHIEAGARRFMDLAKAIADDLGTTPAKIKPYLRSWYNGARDMMEDAGLSIEGMDDAREVGRLAKEIIADSPPSQQAEEGDTLKSAESPEVAANVDQSNISPGPGQMGEDGKPETDRGRGTGAGPAAGTVGDRNLEGGATGPDAGDAGMGRAGAAGARSGGQDGQSGSGEPQKRPAAKRRKAGSGEGLADVRSDRDRAEGTGRANYHIADPDALFAGGPKARFAKNRAAMEAYQRVSDEDREPTPAELDAMAAFTGWGSFGQELFQGNWGYRKPKDGWTAEDQWLRDHLGKEGWESAQASIINAHYTDPPTVQAIWSAIEAMGFKGGRVLEPAMGIGNFFGMMPRTLEANSQLFGIELEKATGTMAKMLYPRANVRIMGYEKSRAPDGFYDLVIGNWPFANVKIADRRYDHLSPSLHDYFFVKALDQVRPGGLVVGITSAFSMDGQKNKGVRQHLARNAELVAAFRLPSGAFEKYAGTKVVTDLIILRKREEPAGSISGESWVQSVPYQTPAGDTISVNQYFIENPAQVLGTLDSGSGTTYGQKGMIVRRPDDIADQLSGIAARVPADAYKAVQRGKEPRFTANTTTDRRFSVTIGKDGALYQVLGDQMAPLEDVARFRTANKAETENRMAQVKYLVGLRRAAESVLEADQAGSEDADTKRKALKKEYQGFLKAHGRINDSFGLSLLRKLNDPNAGLIAALETAGGDPSPLMERPTVRATRKLDDPSIRDAFVMARNENVRLDLDRVADLSKKPVDEVIADLLASKAIYRTPGGGYEASDAYLSGNVRQKLREAREALADGEDMQDSVNALQEVQPPDVPYFQIEARFGADWIKPEVNRQFIIETLGLKSAGEKDIILTRGVTGWSVEVSDKIAHMPGLSDITGAPSPGRRGTGLSLRRFIEATMNTQTITVTYEDDEGTHKDTKATEQANQKAGDLRQKFGAWVWSDPERRVDAERDYNEVMNAVATPRVDGSFLEFPGMALKRGDQPFNLRQHQADAIWKGILNQRGIYGHEVGTGKTITMTGIAVESRRYGLARKPLLIAHNANSAAVAAEAQETYPGAKILYVNNLAPGEIDAQMARMATEDWDLIVIPHSLLDRMALTYDTLMEMAADDIAAYEREAIEAAEAEGQKLTVEDMENADTMKKMRLGVTAKEMVKARARLIQAIEKQAQRASREGAVSFERLGVDMILVDESHEFKKPPLATRMQVKGLNTGTSNKSLALRFLTSYVKKQRGGTGVHVFTGTPITNTLAEIYHQMFYVMDDIMAQNRVDTWDGFFKTFADTIADVELTSTSEFENVERLAAFINVSELRRMAGQFLDIVFASDMPEFTPRATDSGKTISAPDLTADERDFLENGRVDNPVGRPYKRIVNDIGPMGQDQKRILQEVVGHARAFKAADGRLRRAIMMGGGPDAPIVFNNVPNRASMDARLQEPDAEDHPLSKANRAVKNIARIYLDEPMSTQVLFMDEGYSDEAVSVKTDADGNKTKTKKRKFNLANDIVEKLVAAGVKREEIAIVAGGVTAEKKKAIADAMNARAIRVVIGQTKTLGVGVNMQRYLRAMHHLDAPWMPGDLEQRNGRGERQGNTWNTVLEYRYLTEGLDGRRWQVLAIKDRFIKAFLKAKEGVRNIEGDAADDAETMDGTSLSETLSEAAGDPRLMMVSKLNKSIERLQQRERIHTTGIADAIRRIKSLSEQNVRRREDLPPLRDDATHVAKLREGGGFTAKIDGKSFDERPAASEALAEFLAKEGARLAKGESRVLALEVQGFAVKLDKPRYAFRAEDVSISILRKSERPVGGPTLGSIEAAIRRIPDAVSDIEGTIRQNEDLIQRLERAKDEPFQQAGDLAKKKAQLESIQADMEANPVPAPSWLRIGAPVDSLIFVDGEERVVTGHRWTGEGWFVSTDQGDVPYLDAKDQNGIALYEEREFKAPEISEGSKLRDGSKKEEDQPDEMRQSEPVAVLKGDELGPWEDIRQLGRKAEIWYRENLIGQTVVNAASGMKITFTTAGAKKLSGRKGDVLYRSVPALRSILEKGVITSTSPETKGRNHIKRWHHISATVMVDGKPRDLVAHVSETSDGNFHYDLSRDMSDGARFLRQSADAAIADRRYGLEDNPVDLNLDFSPPDGKAMSADDLREVSRRVQIAMDEHGLAGKINARVVRNLVNASGVQIQGLFSDGTILVRAGADAGEIGVLRHEIVHALRSEALWGRPSGLFTPGEWRALVAAARSEDAIRTTVEARYKDRSAEKRDEEMVAELYRLWAAGRDAAGPVARAFDKIRALFSALANGLRGRGFISAALVLDRIARGDVGGRGPDGSGGGRRGKSDGADSGAEMRGGLVKARDKFTGLVGSAHWKNPGALASNFITDAMAGKGDWSALALVPGRALFTELGKRFMSAKAYLRTKEEMDALRNDWHAKADQTAQKWLGLRRKEPRANDDFMDLMHRTTLAGIDPSRPDTWKHAMEEPARRAISKDGPGAPEWAFGVMRQIETHKRAYDALRERFSALPKDFQDLYREVRGRYDAIGDAFEAAVLENITNATRIGLRRAERAYLKEMERIQDEGLEGDERAEAVAEAERRLAAVKRRGGFTARARIATLRKAFESNRLKGPYFPLARFGDYFVTIRDEAGKVISFSRFEKEAQQQNFIKDKKAEGQTRIEWGVISDKKALRGQVDPTFVADVENMLAEAGATDEVMDAIWQRWLETLPDQSIRTSKIHRKGREGWNSDAFRAFGSHLFHGAHQLARLKYGIVLEDHIDEAEAEARRADDPNRAGLIVNEMRKRHAFTMNPTGSAAVAGMSSAAFIWYLGATPAAALANVSQTTVVGIPMLSARFRKAGVSGVVRELGRAMRDFVQGRGQAENAPGLLEDERAALAEAIRRGAIDKTQAHDLASVAETGIEYNALREKWMRRIGWFFHHAERLNREVTFLAAYRMAKAEGQTGNEAIDTAADQTWRVHFDYQNTSRPRFMQSDIGKILTQFRQFTVNMLWRLARDSHQALRGATKEERAEARLQLTGITLSMLAHAGIRGTWGYGLVMLLLGVLTPGADDDDIEAWLQDALLIEGDGAGVAAWNFAMGAALNGAPGQILGVDLKERIGMPNLWFRGPSSDLEGADLYAHYVGEVLGPTYGIGQGFFRGAQLLTDGEWIRGTEAAVPKVLRDAIKSGRYMAEGVQTVNGDMIVDGLNPYQVLMQASGFTPAQIAERYDANSRLKNQERRITDERKEIHRMVGEAVSAGAGIPQSVMDRISDFNRRYPEYPITGDTIRQSMQSRQRAHGRSEFGVTLNSKLNDRLRADLPPLIYN